MSCEQEEGRVQAARSALSGQVAICDELAMQLGSNDPQVRVCREVMERRFREALADAEDALQNCLEAQEARLLQTKGHVIFLRINGRGTTWGGGQSNVINAEVIFMLDTQPSKAFGFRMRDDGFLPARRGMLDLLRDAFINDFEVTTDYDELIVPPNQNSIAIRVWLTRTRPSIGPEVLPTFEAARLSGEGVLPEPPP